MRLLPDDDRLLHHALTLAREAAAFASPNPAVGCVLAHGGQPFAEGAHRYDAFDHAEIVALQQAATAGCSARGSTAYVTLEPCSHHGRTGPCAEALVAAGIARCVIATVDPNPLVRGRGIARLQAAGVAVEVADPASAIAVAARRQNDAFAFAVQHGRPFVTLKAAVSREGALAPAPHTRTGTTPHWLTGAAARADVQQLRHGSDALLTGIGTVLADDPELTDRTALPRRQPLLRVVLDPTLRLPPASRLVRSAAVGGLLLIAAETTPDSHAQAAREQLLTAAGVTVLRLPAPEGRPALPAVLGALAARDVRSVLLEAGARLNGAMLAAGLVDRVVLYRAPVELGPAAIPFAHRGPAADALAAQLTGVEETHFPREQGEDVRLHGYLHDPWAEAAL